MGRARVLLWFCFGVLPGCGGKVDLASSDAGSNEAATIANHDEDGDGVTDELDNCPNVANPDQRGSASGVGDACRVLRRWSRPWAANARRVYFDPFTSATSSWTAFDGGTLPFHLAPDHDSLHGESSSSSTLGALIDPGPPVGADDAVVVTALFRWAYSDGIYEVFGVVVNLANGSLQLACASEGFGRKSEGVTAGYVNGGGDSELTPSLTPIPHRLGVRAVVALHAPYMMECQLFDPARPETLTDPAFKAWAPFGVDPNLWTVTSRIGIYSRGAVVDVESIDVMRLSQ